MKLAAIINTNNWLSIELILLELYPDELINIEAYKSIFEKLQKETPITSDIEIVLTEYLSDDNDGKKYIDVSGKNNIPDPGEITESLAIEFVPWNKWLGMSISADTLQNFTELEIISHCLFEMTFIDFDETEIEEQFSDINKTMEEYKKMTDEEKKSNTTSLEELIKNLEKDEDPENGS